MKRSINFNLNSSELEAILRLVEAQRELVYHLQKYKEAVALRVEELRIITAKAQEVQKLKHNFWGAKQLDRISEEERKAINIMLQQKHIRV